MIFMSSHAQEVNWFCRLNLQLVEDCKQAFTEHIFTNLSQGKSFKRALCRGLFDKTNEVSAVWPNVT
jgi:hypothetical protein